MITLERVKQEIAELKENGHMTSQNVRDLAALYVVKGKMECEEYGEKWSTSWAAVPAMSRETAEKWTHGMKNADGSTGEHWTYEQTEQVRKRQGIHCDPAEFYATMNMLWSDYGKVAEKFGVNSVEFWAALSEAFLDDADAVPDKVEMYHRYVAGK